MVGKKLLVADDSLTIQKVIRLALTNEGYDIRAVSDGNDALQEISVFRPHVILIDVSLPGKTAFEVKRILNSQEEFQEVRFVLMSSAFEKVDEAQAKEVQFQGRLTKPFDPAHLRQVLTDVLALAPSAPAAIAPVPSFAPAPTPTLTSLTTSTITSFTPILAAEPSMDPPPEASAPPPSLIPPPPSQSTFKSSSALGDDFNFKFDLPSESDISTFEESLPSKESLEEEKEETGFHDQDSDIRHLTESTIRMSGLDDFQWSVKEPSLKPPPGMMDGGELSFPLENPIPSQPSFYTPPGEDTAIGLSPPPPSSPSPPSRSPALRQPPLNPSAPPLLTPPSLASPEMEEVIRKQVEVTLEKMASKILPQVAEKVIKAEIHRLLSEQS